MKRRGQAVLLDIFYLSLALVGCILILAIGYLMLLGLAEAENTEVGIWITTIGLEFLKSMDMSMGAGFILFSGLAIYLASRYATSKLFIPIWIIVFAIMIVISNSISDTYKAYYADETLQPILNQFITSKVILWNFPYIFFGLGLIGFIMTYGKNEQEQNQFDYGGGFFG